MQLLHDKEERTAQIEFGKKLIRDDTQQNVTHKNSRDVLKRKKLNIPQSDRKPAPRKLTGHELELSAAVSKQQIVSLILAGGKAKTGRVQAFDKYAIKFKDDITQTVIWIFKSGIDGIIIGNN